MEKQYEEKLKQYIKENNIKAEQLFFDNLVDHRENVLKTIKEKEINFNDIVKTVVFIDLDKDLEYGNAVIGIVPANSRVNKDTVYAGGGSIRTLIKTTIKEILRANESEIVDILKQL